MFRELEWVAIDFETTGVVRDARGDFPDEPWQIGLVRVREGRFAHHWERLLGVGDRPFNANAPGRHHGIREALCNAPTLTEIFPELIAECGGVPLVAHNIATEKGVLRKAAPMHEFGPWIDTLKLARIAWPDRHSHKLEDLVAELGLSEAVEAAVPDREAHDALYDAVACGLLLLHLLELEGWRDLELDQLVRARPDGFYRR